jgi:hypothetical protein
MTQIVRTLCLFVAIIFSFDIAKAQDTATDSYTIQRLIIYNNDGKVLLEKHPNGWMTPALRHNTKTSIRDGLDKLAADYGLVISAPKLAGNFTFVAEYKPQSSFRQHYVATLTDGELTIPDNKLDAGWYSPHEVVELMSRPDAKLVGAISDMTEHVMTYPGIIWGGTYTLRKEDGVTIYETSENFYPIGMMN